MLNEIQAQLPNTLAQTDFPALGTRFQGKVRDTYRRRDRLILVTTDRLSAFDRGLTTIPFKGEVLNRLSAFWFEKTKDIVKNHVLDVPDPNVMVARLLDPVRVEVVVRGYITGSLWRDYQKAPQTGYGLRLPAGLKKNQRFDSPIITPSTKGETGVHDEPLSRDEILSRGLVDPSRWQEIEEAAQALFAEGQRWAQSRGLILVDTKYEFGLDDGELYVMDEMHTPDCSRFWMADEYEGRFARGEEQKMLDKENIRQWLLERGFSGHGEPPQIPPEVRVDLASKYLTAYEKIIGEGLRLVNEPVRDRVERNLKAAGLL